MIFSFRIRNEIQIKCTTYHDIALGSCIAFLMRHLRVTELPDWAWMSGLPSIITSGTRKTDVKLQHMK